MTNTYKNITRFKKWYNATVKPAFKNPDWDEVFKKVSEQYGCSGIPEYEINNCYTKSGNPEVYTYKETTHYFLIDENGSSVDVTNTPKVNEFDYATSVIVF